MIKDITKQFTDAANPNCGNVVFADRYDTRVHSDEIELAEWLNGVFGGNITLLTEIKRKGVTTPDCIWNNKEWEFKKILSDKYGTIDKRIHIAYGQIENHPGGMVLDFTDSALTLENAAKMVEKSLKQRGKDTFNVIVKDGNDYKVFRTIKE